MSPASYEFVKTKTSDGDALILGQSVVNLILKVHGLRFYGTPESYPIILSGFLQLATHKEIRTFQIQRSCKK